MNLSFSVNTILYYIFCLINKYILLYREYIIMDEVINSMEKIKMKNLTKTNFILI